MRVALRILVSICNFNFSFFYWVDDFWKYSSYHIHQVARWRILRQKKDGKSSPRPWIHKLRLHTQSVIEGISTSINQNGCWLGLPISFPFLFMLYWATPPSYMTCTAVVYCKTGKPDFTYREFPRSWDSCSASWELTYLNIISPTTIRTNQRVEIRLDSRNSFHLLFS